MTAAPRNMNATLVPERFGLRTVKAPARFAQASIIHRAELKTLMEHCPNKWRPLPITAMFTGMRASRSRGLPWTNVDLSG